jgi:DnaJ homolog subfamily C member 19
MPYLLLFIGGLFAVAALYRFFLKAEARQVKAMLLSIAAIAIGLAALFLAVTGRLPAAIAILLALWPVVVAYLRTRTQHPATSENLPMTEKEAYEVLGLPVGAAPEDIKEAHIRLMKKVHPDLEGSDWLAKKINAAKDLLLKQP